ncbi:Blue-light-activated protein [Methylobacterium crusticola]|uniref:Blue-light-activated protein n=1 Tax=Methylobacterium crusticola TaxID=1697972 RepID=A0ABQ4R532_9HYPH|nr:response regulator [Methylobacterium crusticola]GJD52801.1 Blue-light-activated protein [Methylobacterium crusticola]
MSPSPSVPVVVLVVEDEGLVRLMAVDMLEDAGLTVLEAGNADAALGILESRSDVAILFTDVDMPGSMNGFALAARVAERWPGIRLVITSGRCQPAYGDMPDAGLFLAKPYLPGQLVSAIRPAG